MHVRKKSNKKGSDFKGNQGYSCMNVSKQTEAHPALSAVMHRTLFFFLVFFSSIFNSLLTLQQRLAKTKATTRATNKVVIKEKY